MSGGMFAVCGLQCLSYHSRKTDIIAVVTDDLVIVGDPAERTVLLATVENRRIELISTFDLDGDYPTVTKCSPSGKLLMLAGGRLMSSYSLAMTTAVCKAGTHIFPAVKQKKIADKSSKRPMSVVCLEYSTDESHILLGTDDGAGSDLRVTLVDFQTLHAVGVIDCGWWCAGGRVALLSAVVVSPQHRLVAVATNRGSSDTEITIHDMATPAEEQESSRGIYRWLPPSSKAGTLIALAQSTSTMKVAAVFDSGKVYIVEWLNKYRKLETVHNCDINDQLKKYLQKENKTAPPSERVREHEESVYAIAY